MNNNRLKEVRTERGMSVSELARRTGLSRIAIIKIENNESNPTVKTVSLICKTLDKSPSELFFNDLVNHE